MLLIGVVGFGGGFTAPDSRRARAASTTRRRADSTPGGVVVARFSSSRPTSGREDAAPGCFETETRRSGFVGSNATVLNTSVSVASRASTSSSSSEDTASPRALRRARPLAPRARFPRLVQAHVRAPRRRGREPWVSRFVFADVRLRGARAARGRHGLDVRQAQLAVARARARAPPPRAKPPSPPPCVRAPRRGPPPRVTREKKPRVSRPRLSGVQTETRRRRKRLTRFWRPFVSRLLSPLFASSSPSTARRTRGPRANRRGASRRFPKSDFARASVQARVRVPRLMTLRASRNATPVSRLGRLGPRAPASFRL